MKQIRSSSKFFALGGCSLLAFALPIGSVSAETITQSSNDTVNDSWNNTVWGGSAASGNDYVTKGGFFASSSSLGNSFTGRLRDTGTTFDGDSLKIVSHTELLLKQTANAVSSATIILDGGMIRYSPDNGTGLSATIAGSILVMSDSTMGVVQQTNSTLNITSTITGAAQLRLAGDRASGAGSLLLEHSIVLSGDLSGFTGTFFMSGGLAGTKISFASNYFLKDASLVMGTEGILNLSHNIAFDAFTFGSTALNVGTYTAPQLNTTFSTTRFIGSGTFTVIPDPSSALAGGLCLFGLLRRRRA